MTTLFVELDQLVAFLPIVYQLVVKTKFFFLKPDQKIGRGRSTCQLLLFIIFATIDIIGIMKQNLKSLWIIGKLVLKFSFLFFFNMCICCVKFCEIGYPSIQADLSTQREGMGWILISKCNGVHQRPCLWLWSLGEGRCRRMVICRLFAILQEISDSWTR